MCDSYASRDVKRGAADDVRHMRLPSPQRRKILGTLGSLASLMGGLARGGEFPAIPGAPAAGRRFALFDALLYAGKPDLRSVGLVPIEWVGDLWRPGVAHEEVDEAAVRAAFAPLRRAAWCYLDIESWPVGGVDPALRARSIKKLARVIEIARMTAPGIRLGFYGILPDICYWPLLKHDAGYVQWLQTNRQLDGLAARVDAVFPSLYTFYEDLDGWRSYARQTLVESRRWEMPVYAFLWPEFHDSNLLLRGRPLPRSFWRAQLELCGELADGVVLWGGWRERWSESAEWWQETLQFIRAHPAAEPVHPWSRD